jgi:kynurenine formamidase
VPSRFVDLSHAVEDGQITCPGLPAPVIDTHLSREASRGRYAPGTEFQIGRIEMVSNTGTYLDTPFHRFEGGADLARLPLESVADLPGIVVDAEPGSRAIGPEALPAASLQGRAVLFRTGW